MGGQFSIVQLQDVAIEKLVYGGSGLARIDGRVVLIPLVLPGERVSIEIQKDRGDVMRGKVVRVLEASPYRVTPTMPKLSLCGAHYQHIDYPYQVAQKIEILREVIRRVGKLEAPEEIRAITAEPWGYRNRSQFHLQQGRIGYLESGSHRLAAIEQCPMSAPLINSALTAIWRMIGERRFPGFLRQIELFTNGVQVQFNVRETDRPLAKAFFNWCAEQIPGYAEGPLDYVAGEYELRVHHNAFFQVNRFLVEALVNAAIEGAEGQAACDLYAGVGLFSLPLARRFQNVDAVESGSAACADLQFNAERAQVEVKTHKMDVAEYLSTAADAPDFVLADPPRTGLGKPAIGELQRLKPRQLTIVSCDPATLARDLAPLIAAGYKINGMTLIDLFPQTYHIESITKLTL